MCIRDSPGDNEFMFRSIHGFVDMAAQYDMLLGYIRNPIIRPLTRRVASQAFVTTVRFLYGFPFQYLNGFNVYRLEYVRGLPVISSGHSFFPELVAKAQLRHPDLRIGEVPFAARGRAIGDSRAFQPRSIAKAVREVVVGHRSTAAYRDKVIAGDSKK